MSQPLVNSGLDQGDILTSGEFVLFILVI